MNGAARRLLVAASGCILAVISTAGGGAQEPLRAVTGDIVADGVRYARDHLARYGGAWIDGEQGVLIVAVAGVMPADDLAEIRRRVPDWVRVETLRVDHSEQDLIDVYEAATAAMASETSPGGITSVAVRERGNLVEIGLATADFDRLGDDLRAAFGSVRISLRRDEGDHPTTCTRTDCNNSPWKAGIYIDKPDQGDQDGPCTSGFIVYRPDAPDGPAYRMVTAGHCGYDGPGTTIGDTWYHNSAHTIVIGDVTHTRYTGETACDCQLIDIASGREGHKHLKGGDNVADISSIRARSDTLNGDPVCLSGITSSSRQCGEITSRWYSTDYGDGVTLINQMLADYTTNIGDSGGPVMARYSESAVGIQSGKRGSTGEAVFTHISGFQNEFTSYTLCTSTDSHTGC